jgi:hypothetical protein
MIGASVTSRVSATIYFNTDRYGSRRRTGAFDSAEFAKLTQDFDSFRKSPAKHPTPYYYVIYSLDNRLEGQELCLFFHEVERIKRDES